MYIAIVCFPSCDVINFLIKLIFLSKLLFCMNQNSIQKFEYLEDEMSF